MEEGGDCRRSQRLDLLGQSLSRTLFIEKAAAQRRMLRHPSGLQWVDLLVCSRCIPSRHGADTSRSVRRAETDLANAAHAVWEVGLALEEDVRANALIEKYMSLVIAEAEAISKKHDARRNIV